MEDRKAIQHHFKLGNKCLIIGEVGQSHDGSLGTAHAFIDAISKAGADAVKFQTHIASAESTPHESWRVKFSQQDSTRYGYWERMEFTENQWHGLKKHAEEVGLLFLSSPFSLEALQLLTRVGVAAWKVGSGEVNNNILLEHMIATGLPILLSTGMSLLSEIDNAVAKIKSKRVPFAVMQCTSAYPCPPEKIGLNLIPFFRKRYGCSLGLSDHSGTIYPSLTAASMGIDVLEIHVTLSREMFGPDIPASITTLELAELVEGVRFIEKMISNPVDKDLMADQLASMRVLFTKSIVTCNALKKGVMLCEEHLTIKKPGTGIPSERIHEFVGRRLRKDVPGDHILLEDDLEKV